MNSLRPAEREEKGMDAHLLDTCMSAALGGGNFDRWVPVNRLAENMNTSYPELDGVNVDHILKLVTASNGMYEQREKDGGIEVRQPRNPRRMPFAKSASHAARSVVKD